MKSKTTHTPEVPVVLLDGSCAHCHEWKERLLRHGPNGKFRYMAHRTEPVDSDERRTGACKEPLAVIDTDGHTFTGMEAIVKVMSKGAKGKAALLYYVPGIKTLMDKWLHKRSKDRCKFARHELKPEQMPF